MLLPSDKFLVCVSVSVEFSLLFYSLEVSFALVSFATFVAFVLLVVFVAKLGWYMAIVSTTT